MGFTILMVLFVVLIGLRFIPKNPAAAARRVPMSLPEKLGMVVAWVAIIAGYFGTRVGFGPGGLLTKDQWLQVMMAGLCAACVVRLFRRFTGRQSMVVSGRDNVYFDAIVGTLCLVLAAVPISALMQLK